MSKTITVYTLAELKTANPDAFASVLQRWAEGQTADIAWASKTINSLKAVVDACGGVLHEYSIGPDQPCSMSVSVADTFSDEFDVQREVDNGEMQKDGKWLYDHVLNHLGYTMSNVGHFHVEFPGLCPWTGYCADEDFIEHVYKRLEAGDTLTEALESLAGEASKHMADDLEQQQGEDCMMMNCNDLLFTEDGTEV